MRIANRIATVIFRRILLPFYSFIATFFGMRVSTVFVIALMAVAVSACAQQFSGTSSFELPAETDSEVSFTTETVVDGLVNPWGMVFLPGDEGILVSERPGRLRIVRNGELDPVPVSGLPQIATPGQGGLLDVALHPDFVENRLVYFSYTKSGANGATTAVARGALQGSSLEDVEDLFVADAWGRGGRHFGSRILLQGDYLYVTIGDRGEMNRAQNLEDHAGSTVRLYLDGSVPPDNPFVGSPNIRDEIYTYGNRNSQGMAAHPDTGDIWQSEHGPRGGDEINVVVTGGNYGWPEYRYANHYDGREIPDYNPDGDIQSPLVDWTPAIAPAGITFYTGDAFPEWQGDLFVSSLVDRHLQRVRFDGTTPVETERLLEERGDRIRHVVTGPDGYLYLLVDASSAPLLRLVPASE